MPTTQMLQTLDYLKLRLPRVPKMALVLGSGLGVLAEEIEDPVIIPYGEIPNFPQSTAPGHAGRLVFGRLQGVDVLAMQGRFHYYEGYSLETIAFPPRVFKALGVEILFLTNAAGGVNTAFKPGQIMLIKDHINLNSLNPCLGPNDPALGLRFFDMSQAYDPKLRTLAKAAAKSLGMEIAEGVYMWFTGPSFETPAEIRAARVLGADAVGMSTVPETIAAVHCGLRVIGMSCITNLAAGVTENRITAEEVLEISEREKPRLSAFVKATVAAIRKEEGWR
jgi:purine-nucleoside phosphorylase